MAKENKDEDLMARVANLETRMRYLEARVAIIQKDFRPINRKEIVDEIAAGGNGTTE